MPNCWPFGKSKSLLMVNRWPRPTPPVMPGQVPENLPGIAPITEEALHMTLAAYTATAFDVAGVYAFGILRDKRGAYHLAALGIALGLGIVVSILQAVS